MSLIFPPIKKVRLAEVVTPRAYVNQTARGLKLPSKAVVCPLAPLAKTVTAQGPWKKRILPAEVYCAEGRDFCWVTGFGCGAPAVAMTVEQLVALGVREILFIGLAGSLQEEVLPGDIVVCNESICADGTSPHYTTKELVGTDRKLTARLGQALRAEKFDFHLGRNWSTDGIYRETKAEIKHYQKNRVLTVEMETSAVLAVCGRRKVPCAAVFVVSDFLAGGVWQPDFKNPLIWQNLRGLTVVSQQVLTGIK